MGLPTPNDHTLWCTSWVLLQNGQLRPPHHILCHNCTTTSAIYTITCTTHNCEPWVCVACVHSHDTYLPALQACLVVASILSAGPALPCSNTPMHFSVEPPHRIHHSSGLVCTQMSRPWSSAAVGSYVIQVNETRAEI